MKRIELDNKEYNMLVHIQHPGIQLLPNTSGAVSYTHLDVYKRQVFSNDM